MIRKKKMQSTERPSRDSKVQFSLKLN